MLKYGIDDIQVFFFRTMFASCGSFTDGPAA